MAGDLRGFALEKAELLSGRLKELLSAGQGYVRARFGLELGLEPERYPTWVVLSTAAAGLLLLLALSWAAVCGGLFAGKKRGSPVRQGGCVPEKATAVRGSKTEEPKKRNKRRAAEKKTQPNGQPVSVAQEEVKVPEAVSKQPQLIKAEKVQEAPAPVKKSKKKAKTAEVKPVQHVSVSDGKELDDGAWETKVSYREKKRQQRKDKSSEDSGSPKGVGASKPHLVEAPAAAAPTKKNRGNHESHHSRNAGKGNASVSSSWREESAVNGPGWVDMSLKVPAQMGTMEGTKWSGIPAAPHYRPQSEGQPWTPEAQAAAWSGIDGRIKTDLTPVSFSMLRMNTAAPISNSLDLQWANHPVDDEWSGFNGMAAADPSSDWNAPVEHWGNYEEPPVLVTSAPLLKEKPAPNKQLSEGEKDADDPSGGASKSKKKRKKKKTSEEEAGPDVQERSTAPAVNAVLKPQELPVLPSKKQNTSISSAQKKSEQIVEPPKASQKKKVRKET